MERLKKVGHIAPKMSCEIKESRVGLGLEKLDRNVFDPNKAYDKVAQLGVKWIRIQSGWERTEKAPGEYDFAWIDDIVNNLVDRGLIPWICLCYGNPLYDDAAKVVYGSVGCPPIHTQEQKEAWDRYVRAVVERYRGKVSYYEVWNEPDGQWCWKHGISAEEYGEFVVATSKAIRETDSQAKVIGGSYCHRSMHFIDTALKIMADHIDAITFHEYTINEYQVFSRVKSLRALIDLYNPSIEIIQGESGSQSRSGGAGALKVGAWTPRRQAKQLLRHTIADLLTEVKFMSYFSCVDMIEALRGERGVKSSYKDYGYFGVLGADFDEDGFATGEYTPKPSYYALQNISAVFAEEVKPAELPVIFCRKESPRIFDKDIAENQILYGGFRKPNGSSALFFWIPSDLMKSEAESTITLDIAALSEEIRLVDMMDGSVYELPESMVENYGDGHLVLNNVPIRDYPMALLFGAFADVQGE